MISDQHEDRGLEGGVQTARRVGHDQGLDSQRVEHPRGEHDRLGIVTLIEMKAPALEQHRDALQLPQHQLPAMTGHARLREPGDLAVGDDDGPLDLLRQATQPGAQHDPDPGPEVLEPPPQEVGSLANPSPFPVPPSRH